MSRKRRMFNSDVIQTDWFTDMPATTQLLYIHLSMDADDDGFVTSTKAAMFNAHASTDDLAILVAKNYVIRMDDKLYLIKHWRQNNILRNDRYLPSSYSNYLDDYTMKPDGSYTLKRKDEFTIPQNSNPNLVYQLDTNGIPTGYQLDPQDKIREEKIRQDNVSNTTTEGLSTKVNNPTNNLRLTDNNNQPSASVPPCAQDEWWPVFKEFDYLKSEDEYRKKPYHDLLEYLSDKYGRSRVRLYLKLFVSGQEGKEINDRFNFLKKCLPSNLKEESQASKPSSGESKQSDQKPQTPAKPKLKPGEIDFEADYQARNGGRLIEDDTPHATDEDVDKAFKEMFGDDYAPRKD